MIKCQCPDRHDIRTGIALCTRCDGLKIDIPIVSMSEAQRKEYQKYLNSLEVPHD